MASIAFEIIEPFENQTKTKFVCAANISIRQLLKLEVKTISGRIYIYIYEHRMHKWLLINYSFIFVQSSLTSLVSMRKIQKNF